MTIDRRRLLLLGLCAGGASLVSGALARRLLHVDTGRARFGQRLSEGYGPLSPLPAKNTGEVVIALPRGFEYTVFGPTGSKMSDGHPTPAAHDGMAAFDIGGELRLVRNHEVAAPPAGPLWDANIAYDPLAGGGTTTLVIDPETRELRRDFLSLCGTLRNCAGGPTPWRSWITCEEIVVGVELVTDALGRVTGGFEREHGYCFDVSAASDGPVTPVPLHGLGRFVHEAVAVDPATGIVYETEDNTPSGFYRFMPVRPGELAAGGVLEMLAIDGRPGYDTRRGQTVGVTLPVRWVKIADPDPAGVRKNDLAVFDQGAALGGAAFARLEGCWYGDGSIYVNATKGGDVELGQVWRYVPRGMDGGELTLVFESPDATVLNAPDNICTTPKGGLMLCEDCPGIQYLRGLTREGAIYDFARNVLHDSEFAGATFSPDGRTLFCNIQRPGVTLAIWGDWQL